MRRTSEPNYRTVVDGFTYLFDWNKDSMPGWDELFDRQLLRIHEDIHNNREQSDLIVYLSCPISNRGGGHYHTNTLISEYTADRIRKVWGSRVWILNPTQYQMESSFGEALLNMHAKGLDVDMKTFNPSGGDYMRMWVKALVADDRGTNVWGNNIDVFYFLSQSDIHAYFQNKTGIEPVTDAIYSYLSQRVAVDDIYRKEFLDSSGSLDKRRVRDYIHYYAVGGGAASSSGCRDEWNIWVLLNKHRQHENQGLKYVVRDNGNKPINANGIGEQIPGYYNGLQLSLSDEFGLVTPGYGFETQQLANLSE